MGRYISFAVLFGILIVIGILFYKVMIGFFVPVFMAVVLVVVFRPLHRWVLSKVGDRDHVAASITTCLIVLIVLMPTALVLTMAAVQGAKLSQHLNKSSLEVGLRRLRSNDFFNLESPCSQHLQSVQTKFKELQDAVAGAKSSDELTNSHGRVAGYSREIKKQLSELPNELLKFEESKLDSRIVAARKKANESIAVVDIKKGLEKELEPVWNDLRQWLTSLPLVSNEAVDLDAETRKKKEMLKTEWPTESLTAIEKVWLSKTRNEVVETGTTIVEQVRRMNTELDTRLPAEIDPASDSVDLVAFQDSMWKLAGIWQDARQTILGGQNWAYLKDLANPSTDDLTELTTNVYTYLRPQLISFTGDSVSFLVRLLIGSSVLLVSLYFFLCDGPGMVRTLMDLSPLDDRYEMELLAEFDRTARAIVVATILSAVVQGLAAGIGYYFAGVPSLVMLTAVTAICALIPFFGTGIVWVPVCIYLALYEERFVAAGVLALWGFLVVGTVDNLVKVFVLHGRSQLHPLLALLSVLGGIQTLGPIGIVVGPMAVTLLQTTLGIMRHELSQMKDPDTDSLSSDGSVGLAIKPLSGLIRKVKKAVEAADTEANKTDSDNTETKIPTRPVDPKLL